MKSQLLHVEIVTAFFRVGNEKISTTKLADFSGIQTGDVLNLLFSDYLSDYLSVFKFVLIWLKHYWFDVNETLNHLQYFLNQFFFTIFGKIRGMKSQVLFVINIIWSENSGLILT